MKEKGIEDVIASTEKAKYEMRFHVPSFDYEYEKRCIEEAQKYSIATAVQMLIPQIGC